MNCKQARQQISDIPCAPASPQPQHHTIHCRACAELLAGQTAHHAALAHLRAEAAALTPSASVEHAVLAALHNPANPSHDSRPPVQTPRWVSISALACATLLIAALLFFGIRHHRARPIASAEDPFIAMPYVVPPAPYERTTVIRTQLSVQIMQSAGFQVHGEDPASTALADVLYGEDGRILALRLVSQPNPAFEKRID